MSKLTFEKGKGYIPSWHIPFPLNKINKHFKHGGVPSGTIMQFQSSGEGTFKSSCALQLAAQVQEQGLDIAYLDVENAVVWEETGEIDQDGNPIERCEWFENLGINSTDMYYVGGNSQEVMYESIKKLIEEYGVKFLILDSVPAMEPEAVHEQEAGENRMGLRAKINTVELVKLTGLCRKYDATVCGINHKKAVITDRGSFGEQAVGGKGFGFYSQLIIVNKRTTSRSQLEDKNIIDLDIYIEKNKFGKQFVPIKVKVEQGYGIVEEPDLMQELLNEGLLRKKSAGWYDLLIDDKWESVAQGDEKMIFWLRENKQQVKELLDG